MFTILDSQIIYNWPTLIYYLCLSEGLWSLVKMAYELTSTLQSTLRSYWPSTMKWYWQKLILSMYIFEYGMRGVITKF